MPSSLRNAWDRIAVHLLPSRCFVCGTTLPAIQHLGSCATCWSSLAPSRGPSCRRCALPLGEEGEACARCSVRPLPLEAVTAAFVYDDVARRFLLRAKISSRPELLAPFGRQLAVAVRSSGIALGVTAIVPVPSDPWTRLRRGFDPAAEIARALAGELRAPTRGQLRRRLRFTGAAKSMSASARWRSVHRAFVAAGGVRGTVLLVDDVLTTGATASACARALREAGAGSVRLAVWARTL